MFRSNHQWTSKMNKAKGPASSNKTVEVWRKLLMGKEWRRWKRETWNTLKGKVKGQSGKVAVGQSEPDGKTAEEIVAKHCPHDAADVRKIQEQHTLTIPENTHGVNLAKTPSPVQTVFKEELSPFPNALFPFTSPSFTAEEIGRWNSWAQDHPECSWHTGNITESPRIPPQHTRQKSWKWTFCEFDSNSNLCSSSKKKKI